MYKVPLKLLSETKSPEFSLNDNKLTLLNSLSEKYPWTFGFVHHTAFSDVIVLNQTGKPSLI